MAYTATKTFVIDHPLEPETKHLVHGCLEGPEAGVYYRGRATLPEGSASVRVTLPDYATALASDFTVQVTPVFTGVLRTLNVSEVTEEGMFEVFGPAGPFHWSVTGRRAAIEVEPLKSAVSVQGDGPYKWIA